MDYAVLVENSNDVIQVVDFDGKVIYVNQTWRETFGYNNEDLKTFNFFNLLHDDCHCDCQARIQRLLNGEVLPCFEVDFKTKDGRRITAEGSISLYREQGEPRGIQGFFRDITERKKTEKALQASEARFRTIFQSSVAGIAMLAPDGHFLQVNPAFCNALGYTEEELLGMKITDVTHPDDIEETLNRRSIARANRSRAIVCEKRYLRKDGSVFWAQLSSTWFFDADGHPLYTVPVIQDITRRKEAELRIRELAYYDSLTRLPNRSLFRDRLDRVLAHTRRRKGHFALMFLDLDRFKTINDTLGHAVGDEMLCQVAERLSDCLRENDTVARLGGDEFVIILSEYRTVSNLPRIATKILKSLAQPFDLGVRSVHSSVSIGVALYPQDGEEPDDLLRCADMAMYAAKDAGGDTFRFYSSKMNEQAVQRMDMEADMRRALEEDQFFVTYQPQVDLSSNTLAGFEALVRWEHPRMGTILPDKFIPLAEETNLILALGRMVMEKVFRQCAKWQRCCAEKFRVAINVSGRQIENEEFIDVVSQLIKQTGVDPEWIEFEITESVLMENEELVVDVLNSLRDLGIQIAIDDFGTGYSSLSSLKNLPVNRLKIDKSFVSDLQNSASDRAIVGATIDMAKNLGLEVIAEGVETRWQCGFIHENSCSEVQGFFFSRPLSVEEVENQWLNQDITPASAGCDGGDNS